MSRRRPPPSEPSDLLSAASAGKFLGVSADTMTKYMRDGSIPTTYLKPPDGAPRVRIEDVHDLARRMGIRVRD